MCYVDHPALYLDGDHAVNRISAAERERWQKGTEGSRLPIHDLYSLIIETALG